MAEQLVFPIAETPSHSRADFIPTEANAFALSQIDRTPDWGFGKLVLTGPIGAGKSHLAAIWAAEQGGIVVPAAEAHLKLPAKPIAFDRMEALGPEAEEVIFHLHNRMVGEGLPMLFVGRDSVDAWRIALPDLRSRLAQSEQAEIDPPDDMLLQLLLIKRFSDRQIHVTPATIPFLLSRLERSYQSVHEMVGALDTFSLKHRRKITRTVARDILGEAGEI